jgi:Zn-dependent protease with chaperone function
LNFFEHQSVARRNSRWLVLWYALAACATVASYVLAAALAYAVLGVYGALPLAGDAPLEWNGLWGTYFSALARVPWQFHAWIAGLVGACIALVTCYRLWQLSDGGPAIADLLGARYVESGRCMPAERKLLNVVEEMAIASGIAVPPVYVLDREDAINALVAGYSPNEAVIIVTRGALRQLSRDELQGVMGHEFSHILNGDMALNVRLVGILAGLTWLGERGEALALAVAEQTRRAGPENAGIEVVGALFGMLLAFIGFPGTVAADAIKAAISREREFLADASSVQFTRNPDGIAGALDTIVAVHGHTTIPVAYAGQLSHMFFAPAVATWWQFPTHPPIDERIRRAHPRFMREDYRARRHGAVREVAVLDGAGNVVKHVRSGLAQVMASVGRPTAAHLDFCARLLAELPQRLREALRSTGEAEAAMFALLLGSDPRRGAEARALEASRGADALASAAALQVYVGVLYRQHMLTLAELAVPAIKEQPQKARDRFLADFEALVQADRRVTLREFVLLTFLRQRLREGAGQPIPTRFQRLEEVSADAHIVLSMVALAAGEGERTAFEKGAAVLRTGWREPVAREALTTQKISEALERIRQLAPFEKPAFLKACVEAVTADGVLRLAEVELVRMVAATLDCPIPPLLAHQDPRALAA